MIGLLLVGVAVCLAVETESLLIGEAARRKWSADRGRAGRPPGVGRIIHLRTLHLGPEMLVAAKIGVGSGTDTARQRRRDDRRRGDRRPGGGGEAVTWLYLEPDVYDPNYVPDARPERPGAPSH